MSNKGLLKKAIQIGADNDQSIGISPEDREEIAAQIEEITRKNRIDVGAERFILKPIRHGFLLPLAVNALVLGGTAGALWGLSSLFTEREAEIYRSGTALSSAEGKLIQELKRDAESRLTEKDKEITDIQARLAAIEQERNALQMGFDEQLAAKEAELRNRLEEELERERARLLAEGLSDAIIQERLKKFEEERLVAYRIELDEYKKRLDAERSAAEENFNKLQAEYRSNITVLNEERKKIQDDSRRREEQLRASLEQKAQELETRSLAAETEAARAAAGLELAKQELARLEEQRKSASAAEDRIVGLYAAVQGAYQERRYDDAVTRSAALRSYLEDPSIATLPSLQNRRPADLFAADTLGQMARIELERAKIDTNLLLSQAETLASVRALSAQARSAAASGNASAAATAYQAVLARIPEIMEAHGYLTRRYQTESEERLSTTAAALAAARSASTAGNYQAAATSYGDAAEALGLSRPEAEGLVSGIGAMAVTRSASEQRAADTRAAQSAMTRASQDYNAGRFAQAANAYAGVLNSYPMADQKAAALKGIDDSLASLLRTSNGTLQADIRRSQELEAEVARLTAAQEGAALASSQRIAELERLLDQARRDSSAAVSGTAVAAGASVPPSNATLEQDLAALRQENARLGIAAQQYDSLRASFVRYSRGEDAALAKSGTGALVEARNQLDAFLLDTETRRAFPDLRERIARYEREFVAAGQRESIFNAMSIAEDALGLRDAAARERYFADISARYAGDADMTAYIDALKRGLR